MKTFPSRLTTRWVAVLLILMAAAVACQKETKAGDGTETIAPASPQPGTAASDTDEALTQTVDIETGRSEAEGGGLTSPNAPVTTGTDTAATAGTTTTTTTATTTTR